MTKTKAAGSRKALVDFLEAGGYTRTVDAETVDNTEPGGARRSLTHTGRTRFKVYFNGEENIQPWEDSSG